MKNLFDMTPVKEPPPKVLKTWKSKDKLTQIDLVRVGKFYSIVSWSTSPTNSNARSRSTQYLNTIKSEADALKEYNAYLKKITPDKKTVGTKKVALVKAAFLTEKECIEEAAKYRKKIAEEAKDLNNMNTDDKLALLAAKGKVVVKKKRTSAQVLTGLKNSGKKILKMEARIKEKMNALKKEQEKIKKMKTKLHERIKNHLARVKDRKMKKGAQISPGAHNVKVPKQDLAKAIKKK